MRFYMFGMDGEQPEKCAKDLKVRGFSAVVSPPNERAAEALHGQGMDVWGCVGAFSMREGDPQEWLAEDAFGKRRRWFGSGCPNERALWERGYMQIERWKRLGAKGVLADGARFASPCPGTELFLSCFCPRCMSLGAEMGYDMHRMREQVRLYANTPGMRAPQEWLRFREECTARWFAEFSGHVQSAGMASGSFVFAPSLSSIVGQTPKAAERLQIVAPMLYRKYRPMPGIATLNDEYACLWRFYEERGDIDPAESIRAECDLKMPVRGANLVECSAEVHLRRADPVECGDGSAERGRKTPVNGAEPTECGAEQIRRGGFGPEVIGTETVRARSMYSGLIAPIIQLDDERIDESIAAAKSAGADAIGFFAYGRQGLERLPDLEKI